MAHSMQVNFCQSVHDFFPQHFANKKVLEVGSQDINGNNNHLFENCDVLGIDLGDGPNVNLVCHGADLDHPDESYDTIISTEAFEHDSRFAETLKNIVRLLKPGGLFLFTCATGARLEHGTHADHAWASPFTNNYYKNQSEQDVREAIDVDDTFMEYRFSVPNGEDLQFWGVKNK